MIRAEREAVHECSRSSRTFFLFFFSISRIHEVEHALTRTNNRAAANSRIGVKHREFTKRANIRVSANIRDPRALSRIPAHILIYPPYKPFHFTNSRTCGSPVGELSRKTAAEMFTNAGRAFPRSRIHAFPRALSRIRAFAHSRTL